ncbi:hypothetical protein BJ875DRAFT_475563 [Amylocarpus encephaloides]|uniref:NAD-dependent epimerase/dehydratase domain-containing protein n=1 Tax=Amylocarpus encephaloides TaxID=45428 RepID=A0A9P8C0V4_9HELO|nr:hypothetical protein BJ875DRAFT_475563 [Amylocarpus encephaloides]
MVNVLVIGATGYIGQALTQSLLRSGNHRVFGLARTPQKARDLRREEVIPIQGSISDSVGFLTAIGNLHINVVVDVAGANHESHILLKQLKELGIARIEKARKEGVPVPKLGFIYCSGVWVHGSSHEPVNDLVPVAASNSPCPPAELTSWRPKLENETLAASDVLDVMVIRPGLVYGRSHAIWTGFFDAIIDAKEKGQESVALAIEPDSRPGLIHVDDVATGFHVAIDKLPLISGTGVYPIFDLVTSSESMRDIMEFAAKELGFSGKIEWMGAGDDLFAKAMSTSMNGSSGRAQTILGWEPKRIGLVQSMDVYASAYKASKSQVLNGI